MRKLSALILVGLLSAAVLPVQAKSGFSGTYAVRGSNPGAGPYRGTLTITPRGDVYDVYWVIGGARYAGVGVAVNDTLAVAYTGSDRTYMGVMNYRQRGDGSLDGRWAVQGNARVGTETATRK
jgi:hypothetical protein